MKARSAHFSNPVIVYFWLGILTGAVVVLATIMIQSITHNGSASVFTAAPKAARQTQVQQVQPLNPGSVRSFGPQGSSEFGPQGFGPQGTTSFGPQG